MPDSAHSTKTVPELKSSWSHLVLDAVFPPRCSGVQNGCETWSRAFFCEVCARTLQPISAPFCAICGTPFDVGAQSADVCTECRANRYHASPPFRASRSLYVFEGAIRHAVHRLKYENKTALARPLAALMHDYLRQSSTRFVPVEELTHIVAVPLHARRQRSRGYNQSELLARELSQLVDVPFAQLLVRTRWTTPQVELSRSGRAENVKGAFALKENISLKGATILLIDDVYTTGATMGECARVLKNGGAQNVYALTLAR